MIKQIHFSECHSTQDVLKEQLTLSSSETLLVSCENQTSGRGRGENLWHSLPSSLCFSLQITPNPVMSFTALEISVLVARFFIKEGVSLKLKWPNDLWDDQEKKCGGILVQGSQPKLLAGIGLNYFSEDPNYGGIFKTSFKVDKKNEARDLAEFILNNRFFDTDTLKREWLTHCGHLNEMVSVTEGKETISGSFLGLGDYGEALIQTKEGVSRLFNGSLRRIKP